MRADFAPHIVDLYAYTLWCVLRASNYKIDIDTKRMKRRRRGKLYTHGKQRKKKMVEFPWALNRPICTQLCRAENALYSVHTVLFDCWECLHTTAFYVCKIGKIVIKLMATATPSLILKSRWKSFYYFVTGCGGLCVSINHSNYFLCELMLHSPHRTGEIQPNFFIYRRKMYILQRSPSLHCGAINCVFFSSSSQLHFVSGACNWYMTVLVLKNYHRRAWMEWQKHRMAN